MYIRLEFDQIKREGIQKMYTRREFDQNTGKDYMQTRT